MDFRLHRLPDYSDESLLDELRRVASIVPGGALTRATFDQHSLASASTVIKRFGGWRQALEAAGLASRYSGRPVSDRMRQQPGKAVTREGVLAELRQVAEVLGRRDLTVDDFNAHAAFSVSAVRRHFRPWRRALEAAGLSARPTSARYSDDECFENLLRVWTHLGRPPQYREMNAAPSEVGGKAYVGRWGTWVKALQAFVQRASQDEAGAAAQPDASAMPPPPSQSEHADVDDGRIRLGLRYRVLVRDNFKCVLCGNTPARDPACRLHVDHTEPYSKGGRTLVENLRTLCDSCNVGKGNLTIEGAR